MEIKIFPTLAYNNIKYISIFLKQEYSVSIVIPGHNCSNTIDRALNSIVNQKLDFKFNEVIYIDDGSTDDSFKKVSDFEKKETLPIKKIRLNSSSGGPSKARNLGIYHSKSDYIFFMDSDDYLENFCLSELIETSQKESFPDYVVSLHNQVRKIDKKIIKKTNLCGIKNKPFSKKSFLQDYLQVYCKHTREYCLFEHCWGRLIKLSLIKSNYIFFDETMNQLEDILFNCYVLKKSNNICLVNKGLYNHVLYGSNTRLSSRSGENEKIIDDLNKVSLELADLYLISSTHKSKNLSTYEFIGYFMSSKIMNYIIRLILRGKNGREEKLKIKMYKNYYFSRKLFVFNNPSKDESKLFFFLLVLDFPYSFLKFYLNIRRKFVLLFPKIIRKNSIF